MDLQNVCLGDDNKFRAEPMLFCICKRDWPDAGLAIEKLSV